MLGTNTYQIEIVTCFETPNLDVAAFQSVFEEANRVFGRTMYEVAITALLQQRTLNVESAQHRDHSEHKTIVVIGPTGMTRGRVRIDSTRWLRSACQLSQRVVASGGGTILLATAGLIKKEHIVLHWSMRSQFSDEFPAMLCDTDRLFNKSGNLYTCAGGVANIDCALALVEADFGSSVACEIAKVLVLHHRRPAETSQVSPLLRAQTASPDALSKLLVWIPEHLREDLSVNALARLAAMSPRNFARIFNQRVGATPARYVAELRFEAAQRKLRGGNDSLSQAADASGFQSVETLRRMFLRRLGITPRQFRTECATGVADTGSVLSGCKVNEACTHT